MKMAEYKVKFYKNSNNGKKPVFDYIENLNIKNKTKVYKYIDFLRANNGYLDEPYSKHIKGKIRELRVDFSKDSHRIFYFTFVNKNIILLHAFFKKKEFKKHYEEFGKQLEIAYRLAQLRKEKRMSQIELAKQIGTTQSNVARMESGQQNFTIGTQIKLAVIFEKNLKVSIV